MMEKYIMTTQVRHRERGLSSLIALLGWWGSTVTVVVGGGLYWKGATNRNKTVCRSNLPMMCLQWDAQTIESKNLSFAAMFF